MPPPAEGPGESSLARAPRRRGLPGFRLPSRRIPDVDGGLLQRRGHRPGGRRLVPGAGACGAIAALSYHSAFLVAVPLGLAVVLVRGLSLPARLRAFVAAPVLAVLGLLAVFGLHQVVVGHWNAFLSYQQQAQDIGRKTFNPLAVLVRDFRAPFQGDVLRLTALVSLENALVTTLLLLAAWLWWREGDARRRVDELLLAYAAALWLFASAAGRTWRSTGSRPRSSVWSARWHACAPLLALLLAFWSAWAWAWRGSSSRTRSCEASASPAPLRASRCGTSRSPLLEPCPEEPSSRYSASWLTRQTS